MPSIDHVVIGPPGVFTINAKNLSGKVAVRDGVLVQKGRRRDYLQKARDAELLMTDSVAHSGSMTTLDEDLDSMSREDLRQEVRRLREGVRRHRDSSGPSCAGTIQTSGGSPPESTDPVPEVPAWPQFIRACIRYRESLDTQLPSAPRITREYDR